MKRLVTIVLIMMLLTTSYGWGFYAHRRINRMAVFTLPPEMIKFYKYNIQYLSEKAVNPDKRRYVLKAEAARHYIDLDVYGDSAVYIMPRYWHNAVEQYTEDTLRAYGIVPWHISLVKSQLTQAMLSMDIDRILRYSADIGHYIGDANVPLHTTKNYNGQLTGQEGIHGFWESRLPELFYNRYDLFVGKAEYIDNVQLKAWKAVEGAHLALDSVLRFEKELSLEFDQDKKYSFEERGATTVRVYSYEFSEAYHKLLRGMVERQLRKAIKMVGDVWFTAWVDAGQPDLNDLLEFSAAEEQLTVSDDSLMNLMNHESGLNVDDEER